MISFTILNFRNKIFNHLQKDWDMFYNVVNWFWWIIFERNKMCLLIAKLILVRYSPNWTLCSKHKVGNSSNIYHVFTLLKLKKKNHHPKNKDVYKIKILKSLYFLKTLLTYYTLCGTWKYEINFCASFFNEGWKTIY